MRSIARFGVIFLCASVTPIPDITAAQADDRPDAIYRDRLLATQPMGSIALIVEKVADPSKAKRLNVLPRDEPIQYARRPVCHGFIAHYDRDKSGLQTFIGIQLVRIFRKHGSPGVVYVSRNDGWLSRQAKDPLRRLDVKEVRVPSLAVFANNHSSTELLRSIRLVNGKPLEYEWHARLSTTDEILDTASDEHRRFWTQDPTRDPRFTAKFKKDIDAGAAIRIENHLIRFTVTDSQYSSKIPPVNFECFDPSLTGAALRVYRPFSVEGEAWHFINFQ